jgi:hypothetical protein
VKMPWTTDARSEAEDREAEERYHAARSHLRVLLVELERTLQRIEDKRRRGFP